MTISPIHRRVSLWLLLILSSLLTPAITSRSITSIFQMSAFSQENKRKVFIDSIKNALITMNAMNVMHFRLRNGEFRSDSTSLDFGVAELLTPIIFAHLDADGEELAIAPMAINGGGSGTFISKCLQTSTRNREPNRDWKSG